MGCLKSLFKKILLILIVVAFFASGGWALLKQGINGYKNPPREVFVKEERNFGDLSKIPADFQLSRSFNFFGYKKINAKYLPSNQKITIFDLKNEEKVAIKDFQTKQIDTKIKNLLSTLKDSPLSLEDFQVQSRSSYVVNSRYVPYITFSAKIKNIPFKTVTGVIAGYSSPNYNKKGKELNRSTKLIVSISDTKDFNLLVIEKFIYSLRF